MARHGSSVKKIPEKMPRSNEKPKPGKCKGRKKPHVLSEADVKEIEDVCTSFAYDEITFEAWSNFDKELNLVIPVVLTKNEAEEGTTKEISWSRALVTTRMGLANFIERQRVIRVIIFPPKIKEGWSAHLEGLGDAYDERCGSVTIIVRIV